MIDHMTGMIYWNMDAFNIMPMGEGYEIEVNEFDFRDDNGICYDKDGVIIRHWRRIHNKDGASVYRLEWNGLSFVWTGDGRPDELTAKLGKGCGCIHHRADPGHDERPSDEVRDATNHRHNDHRHRTHSPLCYRILLQAGPAARCDGNSYAIRRGTDP